MTIEQALANIDLVLSNFQGSRQQHEALKESIMLVADKCGVKPSLPAVKEESKPE